MPLAGHQLHKTPVHAKYENVAVQAGKAGHKRGLQASCSIKTALKVPEMYIAHAQGPPVLPLSGNEFGGQLFPASPG